MASKKFRLVDLIVAAAAFVLSLVGFLIPWVATTPVVLGQKDTTYTQLFGDLVDGDFPIALVRVFAIIALVLIVCSSALLLLKALGIFALKNSSVNVLVGLATALCALLAMIFAIVYVSKLGGGSVGSLVGVTFAIGAGPVLFGIGGVAAGAYLIVRR